MKKNDIQLIVCFFCFFMSLLMITQSTYQLDNEKNKLEKELTEFREEVPTKKEVKIVLNNSPHLFKVVLESGLKNGMSQSEAFDRFTNWICENTEYDDSLNHTQWTDILESGTTVCNGYAQMVQLMCYECGIDCYYVVGYINGEQLHAWNYVKLDGIWYWTDITSYDSGGISQKISLNLWDYLEFERMSLKFKKQD